MTKLHFIYLALIALSFAVSGFVEGTLINSETAWSAFALQWAEAAHLVFVVVFSFLWCRAHAASRGIRPPAYSPLLVALVPPIGVPYYFFKSMPLPAAFRSCGVALIFVVVACIGLYVMGDIAAGGGSA